MKAGLGEEACLACDIGGSSVSAAVVTRSGAILGRTDRPLNSRAAADNVLDQLADTLKAVLHSDVPAPDCVGMAVPGPFDAERGCFMIVDQAKFEALHGIPLLPALHRRAEQLAQLPTAFVNDARAFALGELCYGAARNSTRTIILTLGTGCGSAYAVNGELLSSGPGVPEDGFVYAIEHDGATVDDLFSTRGLQARWDARTREAATVAGIAALALAGDGDAREVFTEFGQQLIRALAPSLREFRPDLLVTGGGIARAFSHYAPAARAELERQGLQTEFTAASSLDESALLGAASVAFTRSPT